MLISFGLYLVSSGNHHGPTSSPSAELSQNSHLFTNNTLDTMQLDTEGFEAFGFLTSETFDPSLFSSLGLNLGAPFPGDST